MEYPAYETLLLNWRQPHILQVTFNRPQAYNALNHRMFREFNDLLVRLREDEDTRVVLLYGGDGSKGFCAGLDVREPLSDQEKTAAGFYSFQVKNADLTANLSRTPQPIIAMIHGAAAGAGLSIALFSDIRVCTRDARFSCFYANVGIGGADMGSSYRLSRLIGAGRSYEFLLTGDFFSAQDAWNLGLVSRVVETKEDLWPCALELARTIAAKDPLAVRLTKEALNINLDAPSLDSALRLEDRNQTLMVAHNMDKDPSLPPIGKHWTEQV